MNRLISFTLLLIVATPALGQDAGAKKILERFDQSRPTKKALAFFSLDWAKNVTEAKARALREVRPVFVVWVTNITASCNFFSGHC